MVSSPVVSYLYTQMIGDPKDLPVIKATANFAGIAIIGTCRRCSIPNGPLILCARCGPGLVRQPEQLLPLDPELPTQHDLDADFRDRHWHPLASLAGDVLDEHCVPDEHCSWKRSSRYVSLHAYAHIVRLLGPVSSRTDACVLGIWMENGSGGYMGGRFLALCVRGDDALIALLL